MNVAAILARLGLDTSGFTNGLRQAEREATSAHGRMAGAAGRNTAAHDDLWKSENRIEKQITNVARTALSGADAFQVTAAAAEGLAKSLKLSLGAAAGIGVGVLAVEKIVKMREEARKLQEEIDKLTAPTGPAEQRTLRAIEEHADAALAALKKLEEQQNRVEQSKVLYDAPEPGDPDSQAIEATRRNNIEELRGARVKDLAAAAKKKSQELDISGSGEADYLKRARKLQFEFQEKIGETGTPGSPNENQLLSLQLRRELEQALLGIAESIAQKRRERVQLSLGELAGENAPTYADGNTASLQAIYNAEQAREAQRLEKEAKDYVLRGDLEGGQERLNRADEIKRGIGTLKDSEKDLKGELTGALNAAQVLQDIKTNTARGLTNR